MDVRIAQWIGARSTQEDSYRVKFLPEGLLAVVCDGMGGHHHGAQASDAAAAAFLEKFEDSSNTAPDARLRAALQAANAAVGKQGDSSGAYGGTTLLATYICRGVLRWISVGDSPLFLWRRGYLIRLNEDHSLRPLLERFMTPERLNDSGEAHMLRSAVTGGEITMIDSPSMPYPLLPGDRILLCTDGVEGVLCPRELSAEAIAALDDTSGNTAAALIELCKDQENPFADNTTVVVANV